MGSKKIYIFALAAHGKGISGSDRIFIEFARRWAKKYPVTIYVWEEGYKMCQRQDLNVSNIKYQKSDIKPWTNFGFLLSYIARIIAGIKIGLTEKLENSSSTIVYSASEFWMDSLPTFILKLRYPNLKWVAAWYQTAPLPWQGFTEGEGSYKYQPNALFYWLMQLPIKPLVSKFTDLVLVNNEQEKKIFKKLNNKNKVKVVLGAVDLDKIDRWKKKFSKVPKIYEAVFQGRFHPQKGVMELVDIWKLVQSRDQDAKLIMIGDGPLMEKVKLKIKDLKLEKNIILCGYLFDGEEKYKIFAQSRIVVHPSFYDSGGMAAAEAMAFGLPAVGFNLESFKSYYPRGMIKTRTYDLTAFANIILELLNDKIKRDKIGAEALKMIKKNWSWDERAQQVLKAI